MIKHSLLNDIGKFSDLGRRPCALHNIDLDERHNVGLLSSGNGRFARIDNLSGLWKTHTSIYVGHGHQITANILSNDIEAAIAGQSVYLKFCVTSSTNLHNGLILYQRPEIKQDALKCKKNILDYRDDTVDDFLLF